MILDLIWRYPRTAVWALCVGYSAAVWQVHEVLRG